MKTCVCGCGRPTMPNSRWHYVCKMIREGWSPRSAMYRETVEVIPFSEPVNDPDYATEAMYQAGADAERDALARDATARAG